MTFQRAQLDLLIATVATGLAYLIFLGHRSDYLGHYMAGLGATLGLLTLLLLIERDPLGWKVVPIVLLAIGAGFVTEATIFRVSLFDPVDFCNQSLGACIAGCSMLGTRRSSSLIYFNGALAALLVAGGFFFAFT